MTNARGVSVNPAGTRVYVTNMVESGTVSVFNTSDNSLVATIPVGCMPISVSLNPEGTRAYVVNYCGGVSVIDTANNTVITTVSAGAAPVSQGQFVGPNMCTPPPADMISWWGGDNNPLDMIGANHGTLVNGATFAVGKINQAFSLDGGDDYVNIPHDASLSIPPTSPMSFDLWVYRTSTSNTQHIFSKRNACDWFNYQLAFVEDTGLYFGWNNFQIQSTGGAADLPLNTWTHIAGSSDGTTLKLFINGQLAASGAGTLGPENDDPLKLGAAGTCGTGPFGGFIDEMTIYHRTLSAEEIAASYNAGSAGKCRSCTPAPADMAAWWMAENNAEDSVGSHDGTLVNGATFASGKVDTAFSFDGVNDAIHVGMLGDIGLNETQPFSISAWVNSHDPATASQVIAGNYMGEPGGIGNFSTYLRINDSKLIFALSQRQLSDTNIEAAISPGWQYVTATYDGMSLRLFINGTLKTSTDRTFSDSIDNTRGWDIGNLSPETNATHGFNSSFNGEIDELAIFDRALSSDEIAAIYNAGGAGNCDTDTTPDNFTFIDQTGVNVSTVITSNPITISGINYATDISVAFCPNTSCQYQINSGGWTSIAGRVNNGDTVTVRQTSSNGYSTQTDFVLDIGSKSDSFSISTMAIPQYTVTPSKTGNGTISPDTAETVNHGSTTNFTVTPENGYSVTMGGTCGGTLVDTTYTTNAITADCTVTATFTLNTYIVTPSKTGNGTISPLMPQTINHGSTTTFTVTPDTGYSLAMSGTCGGTLVGATYTTNAITTNCTVIATFTMNSYALTLNKTGAGAGTVTSIPAGINCGVVCSTDYDFGTDVTLTAVPAQGSVFKGWTGDGCTGTGDCTITMDGQKEIFAAFEKDFPWPMFLPAITKGEK
ncbi:MAG: LamG-like jellyroll fold domain-containing protein [Deltaproteobacteria bacterium]|nr:LamG-like jellyroll fold domain-containing protein [Deltaproteobacteria bacterium]